MTSVKKVNSRKIRYNSKTKDIDDDSIKNRNKDNIVSSSDIVSKKIKSRKIRMSKTLAEENELDKAIERYDNMSVAVMVFILVVCFVVGILLGYFLYRIAINGGV